MYVGTHELRIAQGARASSATTAVSTEIAAILDVWAHKENANDPCQYEGPGPTADCEGSMSLDLPSLR